MVLFFAALLGLALCRRTDRETMQLEAEQLKASELLNGTTHEGPACYCEHIEDEQSLCPEDGTHFHTAHGCCHWVSDFGKTMFGFAIKVGPDKLNGLEKKDGYCDFDSRVLQEGLCCTAELGSNIRKVSVTRVFSYPSKPGVRYFSLRDVLDLHDVNKGTLITEEDKRKAGPVAGSEVRLYVRRVAGSHFTNAVQKFGNGHITNFYSPMSLQDNLLPCLEVVSCQ
jgi:hypothetical protein